MLSAGLEKCPGAQKFETVNLVLHKTDRTGHIFAAALVPYFGTSVMDLSSQVGGGRELECAVTAGAAIKGAEEDYFTINQSIKSAFFSSVALTVMSLQLFC